MKKAISLLLCIALVLALGACGSSDPETPVTNGPSSDPGAATDNPVEISVGHIYASSHAIGQAIELFAERVNELSNGTVKVVIYPGSQMGTESEILQQVDQECWI